MHYSCLHSVLNFSWMECSTENSFRCAKFSHPRSVPGYAKFCWNLSTTQNDVRIIDTPTTSLFTVPTKKNSTSKMMDWWVLFSDRLDRMHGKSGLLWLPKLRWLGKLEETVKIIVMSTVVQRKSRRNKKCVAISAAEFKRAGVYYILCKFWSSRIIDLPYLIIFCYGVESYSHGN